MQNADHGPACPLCGTGEDSQAHYAYRLAQLEDRTLTAESELDDVEKAMGVDAVRFMYPPDGGDPTLAEMVGNMRQQLDAAEAALAKMVGGAGFEPATPSV